MKIEINGTAQQGKKETLEFHNIPNQYDEKGNEDTTAIITDFCKKYLDMKISESDISISHRQIHPDEKRKLGKHYVPSVYRKFVSRTTARQCIRKINLLKNLKCKEKRTFVWENLLEKELPQFQHKWVNNVNIFVRKYHDPQWQRPEQDLIYGPEFSWLVVVQGYGPKTLLLIWRPFYWSRRLISGPEASMNSAVMWPPNQ